MLNTKAVFPQKPANTENHTTNPKKFNIWAWFCLNMDRSSPRRKSSKDELLTLVWYWPTIRPSCHLHHDEISIINLQQNNFEPVLRAVMVNTLAEVLHFRKLKCPKHNGELVGGMTKVRISNDAFLWKKNIELQIWMFQS